MAKNGPSVSKVEKVWHFATLEGGVTGAQGFTESGGCRVTLGGHPKPAIGLQSAEKGRGREGLQPRRKGSP